MSRPGTTALIAGAALAVVGVAPILTTMVAVVIAQSHGCQLDEGSVHPCIVVGSDQGDTLYAMGIAFWLGLATIWLVPVGLVLLVVGAWRRWRGRRP